MEVKDFIPSACFTEKLFLKISILIVDLVGGVGSDELVVRELATVFSLTAAHQIPVIGPDQVQTLSSMCWTLNLLL